jgi:hypothetical protein
MSTLSRLVVDACHGGSFLSYSHSSLMWKKKTFLQNLTPSVLLAC